MLLPLGLWFVFDTHFPAYLLRDFRTQVLAILVAVLRCADDETATRLADIDGISLPVGVLVGVIRLSWFTLGLGGCLRHKCVALPCESLCACSHCGEQ